MFFDKYQSKKDGVIRGYDIRSGKVKVLAGVIMIICMIMVVICLFPAVWVFLASFKDIKEFTRNVTIIPEKFDWSRLVYDITYTSIGAAVVEDFYDENVVFLRFCFEKELLKKNPLDRQGRILRMVYLNQDLTKAGKYLFPRLMQKFLVFTDRNGKTSLETMLKRWYTQLEKEYRS